MIISQLALKVQWHLSHNEFQIFSGKFFSASKSFVLLKVELFYCRMSFLCTNFSHKLFNAEKSMQKVT